MVGGLRPRLGIECIKWSHVQSREQDECQKGSPRISRRAVFRRGRTASWRGCCYLMMFMKLFLAVVVFAGGLVACSAKSKAPDATETIRHSLDQSGFKNVSVRQD